MGGIRQFFFKYRGFTPLPLAFTLLYFADISQALLVPGFSLVVLGEWIRLGGVRYAGGATRTRKVGAKRLCTSGPFGYVRNPLYLGNILIYCGIVLLAGGNYLTLMLVITVAFFVIQYGLIISLEEERLLETFGDEYRQYVSAVPRIIPRIARWKGGNVTVPKSWAKTLQTERRTLQILVIFLALLFFKGVWQYN